MNKETKDKIIELREKGWTLAKIAAELGISTSTVAYHSCKDYRKKTIARSIRNAKTRDRKEYNRNYQANRYKNDPEYRERIKKDNRENWRKKNSTK